MICRKLNSEARRTLPEGFSLRTLRPEELPLWKAFPFDSEAEAEANAADMTQYYDLVYRPQEDVFYRSCLVVTDERDAPVATAFLWKAYGTITTLHWVKVKKSCEGLGIGRALLSAVLTQAGERDFPIYLHTHPACHRAIGLYLDFGFRFLREPDHIGYRSNDIEEALPYLKSHLTPKAYAAIAFDSAQESFLQAVRQTQYSQF